MSTLAGKHDADALDIGWVVACGCGYVVEDLNSDQAKRFAEYHEDDEHEVTVHFEPTPPAVSRG